MKKVGMGADKTQTMEQLMDVLKAENDALKEENVALKAENDALKEEKQPKK